MKVYLKRGEAMIQSISDFLLSQWLWSITWDWYHIPINCVLFCVLCKLILRLNIVPAVLISLASNVYSFLVFTFFSFVVLYYLLDIRFTPDQAHSVVTEPLLACLYLGLIYTVIQMSFFGILQIWYKINYWKIVGVSALSNVLTAWLISSLLLKVTM